MNIVPRSGGNTFSGSAFLNTAGEWSSGNNLTDELQALNPNLRQTPGIINAYDWSASFGGPIMRDRLWFYGSYRDLGTQIGDGRHPRQRQRRRRRRAGTGSARRSTRASCRTAR